MLGNNLNFSILDFSLSFKDFFSSSAAQPTCIFRPLLQIEISLKLTHKNVTSVCLPDINPRQIFLCWEKLRLGNHCLSDRAEQQVHRLCYFETSLSTRSSLVLPSSLASGDLGVKSQDLSSTSLETTRSPASVAYSRCRLSLYQHTKLALTWPRRYEQGMENKTRARGWRQWLQPSLHADSHAPLPLPSCPSWRALFHRSSQHEQDEVVLNDSSLFPCL